MPSKNFPLITIQVYPDMSVRVAGNVQVLDIPVVIDALKTALLDKFAKEAGL